MQVVVLYRVKFTESDKTHFESVWYFPVGKIAEKAVCRNVFLTMRN